MSILVTGAMGYIAGNMVELLNSKGEATVCFDLKEDTEKFNDLENVEYFRGSLLDKDFLEGIFKKHDIEAVIHFAASAEVAESVQNPSKYYRNNVEGSMNLADIMLKHDVKRIVFSSSAAVYGNPENIPIKEDDRKAPASPYGRSKLITEEMFSDYHRAYGLIPISLRYFNVAGSGGRFGEEHDPETHIIPSILFRLIGTYDSDFTLFGNDYPTKDGTCVRDYVHVSDLVDAHYLVLLKMRENYFNAPRAFNVGYGNGFSNLEILKKCQEITGKALDYKTGERRPGDPAELVADCSRIVNELGWEAKHGSLDEIVSSAYKFHTKKLL